MLRISSRFLLHILEHPQLVMFEGEFRHSHVNRYPVFTHPARYTIVVLGQGRTGQEALDRHIAESFDAEEVADLFQGPVGGDKLFFGGEINTVKAGEPDWRAAYPHMNFFCAGVAEGLDFALGGGAADDGVIDDDDAFAVNDFPDGGKLDFDIHLAHFLFGRDKCPADVVAANHTHIEGDAGLLGEADGGGGAGVGDGNDDVGFDGVLNS